MLFQPVLDIYCKCRKRLYVYLKLINDLQYVGGHDIQRGIFSVCSSWVISWGAGSW